MGSIDAVEAVNSKSATPNEVLTLNPGQRLLPHQSRKQLSIKAALVNHEGSGDTNLMIKEVICPIEGPRNVKKFCLGPESCKMLGVTSSKGMVNMTMEGVDDTWTGTEVELMIKSLADKKKIPWEKIVASANEDEQRLRTINRITLSREMRDAFLSVYSKVTIEWGDGYRKMNPVSFAAEKSGESDKLPDIVVDAKPDELKSMLKGSSVAEAALGDGDGGDKTSAAAVLGGS